MRYFAIISKSFDLQYFPYLCTKNTDIPVKSDMTAKIVIDHPLPTAFKRVGAKRGVQPAKIHLKRLAALIADAE
jgi:hypothetical protein